MSALVAYACDDQVCECGRPLNDEARGPYICEMGTIHNFGEYGYVDEA